MVTPVQVETVVQVETAVMAVQGSNEGVKPLSRTDWMP